MSVSYDSSICGAVFLPSANVSTESDSAQNTTSPSQIIDPDPGAAAASLKTPPPPTIPWSTALSLAAISALCIWHIRRRRLYDPARAPQDPGLAASPPAIWLILTVGAILIWLATSIGAGSAIALFGLSGDHATSLAGSSLTMLGGYVGASLAALFLFALAPVAIRLALGKPAPPDFVKAAGAFLIIMPPLLLLGLILQFAAAAIAHSRGSAPPDPLAHDTLRLLAGPDAGTTIWWWLTVLLVTLAAPFFEELIFRGLLQSGLLRLTGSAWKAILATSIAFTAVHLTAVEPHALITLFVLSVCFGIARIRTTSLLTPIIMHALFNAANLAFAALN